MQEFCVRFGNQNQEQCQLAVVGHVKAASSDNLLRRAVSAMCSAHFITDATITTSRAKHNSYLVILYAVVLCLPWLTHSHSHAHSPTLCVSVSVYSGFNQCLQQAFRGQAVAQLCMLQQNVRKAPSNLLTNIKSAYAGIANKPPTPPSDTAAPPAPPGRAPDPSVACVPT